MRTPAVGDFILDKGKDLGVVMRIEPPNESCDESTMDVLYIRPYENYDPLNHPGDGDPLERHVPWSDVGTSYIKSYVDRISAIRRPDLMDLECPECGENFLYAGEVEYLCKECR